ncbi:hypothetical protein C1I64_04690 [Rathayibacter festucae DSM 15932]|uniref:Uncharacterized protein n=2 Tax=Rathayibacter festucae TaxID=110937 RepID=A0A3Q9UPY5_9MICO|nr:hypothetical protein C1I64_04690 [Rathayibacter festucae DSM 15932]
MAEFHHVSQQTIRTVKRTKTWPGFVQAKQQRTSYIANAKDRKFHAAEKAGLKPVRHATAPVLTGVEKRLQDGLNQLAQTPTRDEFESAIKEINLRLDRHVTMISAKRDRRTWPWGNR